MENTNEYEVAELLDRNNYRVTVNATDRGYMARFPVNMEAANPLMGNTGSMYYEFTEDGLIIIILNTDGLETHKIEVKCEHHTSRLYALFHIVRYCMYIDYDESAIKFMMGDNDVGELRFLAVNPNPFITEENRQPTEIEENRLHYLVTYSLQSGFDEDLYLRAEEHGLGKSYLLLAELFGIELDVGVSHE